MIFRVMMPADKPRNTSVTIHDHLWKEQRLDPFSRIIPLQGRISIGNKFDIEIQDGAGCPGDYLYRSGSFAWDVESSGLQNGHLGIGVRQYTGKFGNVCGNVRCGH